jgi:hypothetical protein
VPFFFHLSSGSSGSFSVTFFPQARLFFFCCNKSNPIEARGNSCKLAGFVDDLTGRFSLIYKYMSLKHGGKIFKNGTGMLPAFFVRNDLIF